jgi:hypothetical protein
MAANKNNMGLLLRVAAGSKVNNWLYITYKECNTTINYQNAVALFHKVIKNDVSIFYFKVSSSHL